MPAFICTYNESSVREVAEELAAALIGCRVERLAPSLAIVDTDLAFETAAEVLRRETHFVRHLFPVEGVVPSLSESMASAIVTALRGRWAEDSLVGVQVRRTDSTADERSRILTRLSAALVDAGWQLENRHPDVVVSVLLHAGLAYWGVSTPAQNLSTWAGGVPRYRPDPAQVSRAELKLLEALETFGFEIPEDGVALDLGGAPGGWARVVAARGIRVLVVDPGDLHPSLTDNPRITHIRQTANQFLLGRPDLRPSLLLNDMRMGMEMSVRLTNRAARLMPPGRGVVMTLKLPAAFESGSRLRLVRESLAGLRLSNIEARQLYNNGNELTVVGRAA